ncbi:uncharacterized protein LOC132195249 [Neocloeon triangulifer]|uniref:uncharacterized protein LOC132195249 n=1 Tax=Neocloeon triangulifer TaxID=2078957 RepID=UPI00286FACC5|nr:uncharacterized protein LOC132195249 [Neocloeon triangulifer]
MSSTWRGVYCAVPGCMKRRLPDAPASSFHRIPAAVITTDCIRTLQLSQERHSLWLKAISRDEETLRLFETVILPENSKDDNFNLAKAVVCERHFRSGRPSKLLDFRDVDWVPTLNLDYERNIAETAETKLKVKHRISDNEVTNKLAKVKTILRPQSSNVGREPETDERTDKNISNDGGSGCEKENGGEDEPMYDNIIVVQPNVQSSSADQFPVQPQFHLINTNPVQHAVTTPNPVAGIPKLMVMPNGMLAMPILLSIPIPNPTPKLPIPRLHPLPPVGSDNKVTAPETIHKVYQQKTVAHHEHNYCAKIADSKESDTLPEKSDAPKVVSARRIVCIVPDCFNNTLSNSEKCFFSISSVLLTKMEVFLRLKWTYKHFRPPQLRTSVYFCQDHYDLNTDFVDPLATPLVLKQGVLPHLLKRRRNKGQIEWHEYTPGNPLALDEIENSQTPVTIQRPKRKRPYKRKCFDLPPHSAFDLPPLPPPKKPQEQPPEEKKRKFVIIDDEPEEEDEVFQDKEALSDTESWKDDEIEDEEFGKITEEAIKAGKTVRTRRDCKITEWELLPKNLFMKKDDKNSKSKEKEEEVEEEPIYQYVPEDGGECSKPVPQLEMTDKCHYCERWFPSRGMMFKHMKIEHPEYSVFICGYCRKKLGNWKSFYQHIWNHMKMSNVCEFCDKHFAAKVNLLKHQAKFHFSDNEAEQTQPDRLEEQDSGVGEQGGSTQGVECPVCSEVVETEQLLAIHMLGHGLQSSKEEQDAPNQEGNEALECMQKFAIELLTDSRENSEDITIHYADEQDAQQNFNIPKTPEEEMQPISQVFQCTECFKVLESQQHLSVHMMNHGLIYKCDTCAETLEGWSNIHEHMLAHVGSNFEHIVNKNL